MTIARLLLRWRRHCFLRKVVNRHTDRQKEKTDKRLVQHNLLGGGNKRILSCIRCWHGKAPRYLVDCCTLVTDVVGRQRLRSATQQLMVAPRHRLSTVGRRAFAVHGPMVWNSLPDDLRAQLDYVLFKQGLKTWLFSRY